MWRSAGRDPCIFLPSTVYGVNGNKRASHILTLMQGMFNMLLL